VSLAGKESFSSPMLHHVPYIPLTPATRSTIECRGIDVIDSQIKRPFDDGDGDIVVVFLLDGSLTA
jgi:hypothetical protein